MKKIIYAIFITVMLGVAFTPASVYAWANGNAPWGAPVMPGGTTLTAERTVLITEYNMPYQQIYTWYKEQLKTYPDAKYRDWADQMYIEDQGGLNWHSIGIQKTGGSKTTVKITRDNMTWIMSTLLIRFAGVFFVLCVLWLFLNANSAIMKKFFPEKKKA
jgi:hypothetical protein